ncbi:MAG TPA: type IV toxin-antitoxin system AbiEi family antitoxin domain-containing protein [Solirubrobacteraceae bacterium]|nr:type IV toxin-antitoxin system AbiEi family antitoxin domain-containing protein [Solirubrobacteraceae bacterium]
MSVNVHRLASTQGGHITREQLHEVGMAAATVTRWIADGKLIRVYHGVYAVGHLQSNPVNAAHAALLAGGPRSALAGSAALVLWQVWRQWPRRLEVVTAIDRRPSGLIVHRSATLLRRDVRVVQGLRVTSPARTLLDTAARLAPDRRARAVNDLRARGLLRVEDLRDVLARNPSHPAVTQLRPYLEGAQLEPTRSELEDRFLELLGRHGLPTPEVNVHVCGHRVDAYFREAGLIVELDGWTTHRTRERFREDRRRDLTILAATGIPTVRLVAEDVGDPVVPVLRAALSRGRRPPPTRRGDDSATAPA